MDHFDYQNKTHLEERNLKLIYQQSEINYQGEIDFNSPSFVCDFCKDRFSLESTFDQHINRLSINIAYFCEQCKTDFKFTNRCALHSHVSSHQKKSVNLSMLTIKSVEMSDLLARFAKRFEGSSVATISRRIEKHKKGNPAIEQSNVNESSKGSKTVKAASSVEFDIEEYRDPNECPICHKSYEKHGDLLLRKLINSHFQALDDTGESVNICKKCKRFMPNKCALQAHEELHDPIGPYICPECGIIFTTFPLLEEHVKQTCFHHARIMVLKCVVDGCKSLCFERDIEQHFTNHNKLVYNYCAECSQKFDTKNHLILHTKSVHKKELTIDPIYNLCLMCSEVITKDYTSHALSHFSNALKANYLYACAGCKSNFLKIHVFKRHLTKCSAYQKNVLLGNYFAGNTSKTVVPAKSNLNNVNPLPAQLEKNVPTNNINTKTVDNDNKTDDPKTDNLKTDNPKTDNTKADNTKTDSTKKDNTKADNTKTDNTKTDNTMTDNIETDNTKKDNPMTDNTKKDTPKTNNPETNDSMIVDSEIDNSKSNNSKIVVPGTINLKNVDPKRIVKVVPTKIVKIFPKKVDFKKDIPEIDNSKAIVPVNSNIKKVDINPEQSKKIDPSKMNVNANLITVDPKIDNLVTVKPKIGNTKKIVKAVAPIQIKLKKVNPNPEQLKSIVPVKINVVKVNPTKMVNSKTVNVKTNVFTNPKNVVEKVGSESKNLVKFNKSTMEFEVEKIFENTNEHFAKEGIPNNDQSQKRKLELSDSKNKVKILKSIVLDKDVTLPNSVKFNSSTMEFELEKNFVNTDEHSAKEGVLNDDQSQEQSNKSQKIKLDLHDNKNKVKISKSKADEEITLPNLPKFISQMESELEKIHNVTEEHSANKGVPNNDQSQKRKLELCDSKNKVKILKSIVLDKDITLPNSSKFNSSQMEFELDEILNVTDEDSVKEGVPNNDQSQKSKLELRDSKTKVKILKSIVLDKDITLPNSSKFNSAQMESELEKILNVTEEHSSSEGESQEQSYKFQNRKLELLDSKNKVNISKSKVLDDEITLPNTTKTKSLSCYKCNYGSDSRELFQQHIVIHRDVNSYFQCLECGVCFALKKVFALHLLVCHQILDSETYIRRNNPLIMDVGNIPVEVTDETETQDDETASTSEVLLCEICSLPFTNTVELEKHFRSHGMAFLTKKRQ